VSAADVFGSLKNIELYAKHLDEHPNPDNNNWENPDFTTYYRSMLSRSMYKPLKSNGMFKKVWTSNYFKSLLKEVALERQFSGYYGKFAIKMTPPPGARIVIFGEMYGAFHSLTRDLSALHAMGFIDENLVISGPDTYIVFNGNLTSRSAHDLETLTLVLELMKKNPSQVIFIRGLQEDKEHWVDYSLKSALRALIMYSDDKNSIKNEVNRFFNTLPLALYLVSEERTQSIDIVRISNYGTETKDISEDGLGDFFSTQEYVAKINKKSQFPSKTQVNLKAIIRGDQFYRSQYIPSDGLRILEREEGATSWTVLSSPTRAYQNLFDFYYDAFVVLTIYRSLNDWTITLYNRNIKELGDIRARKIFNLIYGVELPLQRMVSLKKKSLEEKISFLKNKIEWVDESYKVILAGGKIEHAVGKPIIIEEKQLTERQPVYWPATTRELASGETTEGGIKAIPIGTDPKTITIGTMIDLTDGVRQEGMSIVQGIRAVFEKQNKLGGIYGKKLNLVFRDMKYSYESSRENCRKLLQEDKVGVILLPLSTVGTEGLLDLVKERSILVLFPSASGASGIRKPEFSNLFFLRVSTITEGYIVSKYVIEKLKAKKLAFFYENNTLGKDSLRGAILGLKELGIKDWIEVPFEGQDLNIKQQVEQLRKSDIDALGCFAPQSVVKELFIRLGTQWLVNKKLFGSMDLSNLSFRKYCERNYLNLVSTSVVPNPDLSDIEIVREYRRAVENMPPLNDIYCLEAYIGADFFIHILEQIGEPITVEKILTYLENVKNYSYKGITLNFNPETRELVHDLWLNTGAGDWKKISFEPSKSLLPGNVIQESKVKKFAVQK
jgi:ABC-type branched-subunit amino acid transport system substrate-binding protein